MEGKSEVVWVMLNAHSPHPCWLCAVGTVGWGGKGCAEGVLLFLCFVDNSTVLSLSLLHAKHEQSELITFQGISQGLGLLSECPCV